MENLIDATDEQIEAYVNEKFKDAPNKAYEFSDPNHYVIMGKLAAIRFEILFMKEVRDNLIKRRNE